ncbi:hypothetical protein MLD38_027124 [Melastoma candidum]|uniref:Uncharacterized protein n=1 Tax=Melastoma candidum TaxID=119954 RepID=A0ACB9P6V5_9MYRT|nr:hypothetical protein MLD38_027124 [Melastoma candidum]
MHAGDAVGELYGILLNSFYCLLRGPFNSGGSMGLWTFLEGQMLVANAFAILNEDRFLAPKGLTLANLSGGRRNSLKGQLVGLISG